MPRHAPGIIITDQDAAIAKAISMVLPSTFHRYCMWHILNKFSEKMNVMVHNEEYHMLVNIIKHSESPVEFEGRWCAIMESTNLGCNEWLCTMYELRSRWVPAYVRHIFSAGMSSSQRSESGHSFFKRYVNRKNSLMDFVTRFNMALRHQRHEELVANHIDITEQPRLTSKFQMEHQMVRVYTKKIFLLFQTEIDQSHYYVCSKKSSSVDSKVYTVERVEQGKTFDRHRMLTHDTGIDYISCSCRTFEFEGYPCRHILSYFKKKQILLLPDKYILRRWTKNAKVGAQNDPSTSISDGGSSSTSLMSRHGILAHKSSLLVDAAALTDARTSFLMEEFDSLQIRITDIDDGGNVGVHRIGNTNRDEHNTIQDPSYVRAKGCGKRLRSAKEKSMSKQNRQCSGCGQHGHDKRTCPTLVERSNVQPYQPSMSDQQFTQDESRSDATFMSYAGRGTKSLGEKKSPASSTLIIIKLQPKDNIYIPKSVHEGGGGDCGHNRTEAAPAQSRSSQRHHLDGQQPDAQMGSNRVEVATNGSNQVATGRANGPRKSRCSQRHHLDGQQPG
ncbi:Protein FAR1-RELATED SEQUENCE 5 [Abeliophyllum distichum]|uniref:Protein FAR1-RELATED SEQUENCE n=1 Tax=Abeliophyllum distichum TaxID=126358 RepID=A0ABD1VCG0_9LAMI